MGLRWIIGKIKNIFYSHKMKHVGEGLHLGSGTTIIGGNRIVIGNDFHAGNGLTLQVWSTENSPLIREKIDSQLKIGNSVSFMKNVMISCASNVVIGNGVLMGDNVFISDNLHGKPGSQLDKPPLEREIYVKGPIIIEDNVWVGRNVCIIGSVHVGKGAVIGANAVVTHDVAPNTVVAGVPAKDIK